MARMLCWSVVSIMFLHLNLDGSEQKKRSTGVLSEAFQPIVKTKPALQRPLLGLPLLPPPTARALSFLSGATPAWGPTAVVACGGRAALPWAGRWLGALHGAGASPLLLWAAAARERRGAAPAWLEGARPRAYALLTANPARMRAFLANDSDAAVADPAYQGARRPLQLRSTARVLLGVLEGARSSANRHRSPLALINLRLALAHQVLGIARLRQLAAPPFLRNFRFLGTLQYQGQWAEQGPSERTSYSYFAGFPQGCKGRACGGPDATRAAAQGRIALFTAKIPASSLRAAVVGWVLQVLGQMHLNFSSTLLGLPGRVVGPRARLLQALADHLGFVWLFDRSLPSVEQGTGANNGGAIMPLVLGALAQGRLELLPHSFATSGGAPPPLDALYGSGQRDSVRVLVPRAGPLPAWSLPLRAFGPRVWAATAGAAAAYALAWRVVARESLLASVGAALRAFSSCGGVAQGRVRAAPQRIMLAAVLVASAVSLVTVYQARLFTLMTTPEYYSEIDTLDQLAESGLELFSLESSYLEAVESVDPEVYTEREVAARRRAGRLQRSIIDVERLKDLLESRQRFALMMSDSSWTDRNDGTVWSRFHLMKETIDDSMAFIHARKNWPWTDRANLFYLRLESYGLLRFWEDDFRTRIRTMRNLNPEERFKSLIMRRSTDEMTSRHKAFSLDDVSPYLQILMSGLVLAFLSFCMELGMHIHKKNRQVNM